MTKGNEQQEYLDDEIDLKELFLSLWNERVFIAQITAAFAVLSIVVSLMMTNIYRSEAILSPNHSSNSLQSKYGSLASLAGIDLGKGETDKTTVAIETIKSRKFLEYLINKHKTFLPDLMAFDNWNADEKKVNYDSDLYDGKQWVRDVDPPKKPQPSLQQSHGKFLGLISISQVKKSNLVTIAIEHESPELAKRWVDYVVSGINDITRDQDVEKAEKSIEYLKEQIQQTSVADIQTGLFGLIESQLETVMLAKATPEYLFSVIDPAVIPELKHKPKRSLIVVLSTIIGFIAACAFVLIRKSVSAPK